MKNSIPIVMPGVIGIYGLIIAVILAGNISTSTFGTGENLYSIYTGMAHESSNWHNTNSAIIIRISHTLHFPSNIVTHQFSSVQASVVAYLIYPLEDASVSLVTTVCDPLDTQRQIFPLSFLPTNLALTVEMRTNYLWGC